MLMVIYPKEKNKLFLERKLDDKIMFITKICNVNKVKSKNNILLIDCNLLRNDGLIIDYNYLIDELFVIQKIDIIIAVNKNDKIEEIANYYDCILVDI